MKQTFIYSLKIWLTSVVISPALYGVYDALTRPNFFHNLTAVGGFYLYSLPYGLVLSIPSSVLFWLSLHSLNMLQWNWISTRILISILAVVLTFAPFLLLFGFDDPASNGIKKPSVLPIIKISLELDVSGWTSFSFNDLFVVKKGKRLTKEDMVEGDTPFIGAIDSKNGYRQFINQPPLHEGNTITVNYNGSVAEAFYQPLPFWASDDVNILYPKFEMTVYTALFITTIIRKEKYRFNFGRKWNKERMESSVISLPSINGKPDYTFMENYIKSLRFSRELFRDNPQLKLPTRIPIKETRKSSGDESKKFNNPPIYLPQTITT